jgi:hypothetical protein
MLMGIPWYAFAVLGVLFAGVFMVFRRKGEGSANFGEPGSQAVKLGRLY